MIHTDIRFKYLKDLATNVIPHLCRCMCKYAFFKFLRFAVYDQGDLAAASIFGICSILEEAVLCALAFRLSEVTEVGRRLRGGAQLHKRGIGRIDLFCLCINFCLCDRRFFQERLSFFGCCFQCIVSRCRIEFFRNTLCFPNGLCQRLGAEQSLDCVQNCFCGL